MRVYPKVKKKKYYKTAIKYFMSILCNDAVFSFSVKYVTLCFETTGQTVDLSKQVV